MDGGGLDAVNVHPSPVKYIIFGAFSHITCTDETLAKVQVALRKSSEMNIRWPAGVHWNYIFKGTGSVE